MGVPAEATHGRSRGFVELDDRVVAGRTGVVVVRAPSRDAADAIGAHLGRRARAAGGVAIEVPAREGASVWREVAARLGVDSLPIDPSEAAEVLSRTASLRRVLVCAGMPARASWDRSVSTAIAALPEAAPSVVLLATAADCVDDLGLDVHDVGATLDGVERSRWWDAFAQVAASEVPLEAFASLEAWWEAARQAPFPVASGDAIPPSARHLATRLALAGRSWPIADVSWLGGDVGSAELLVRAGVARSSGGRIGLEPTWSSRAEALAGDGDAAEVARALSAHFADDPWAQSRAASLLARGGELLAADDAYGRARCLADEAIARQEIVANWVDVIAKLGPEAQAPLLVRACERALVTGDAEEAFRWAQWATALSPSDARVTLLFGRAAAAQGDVVAARMAFERAGAEAKDEGGRAVVGAEIAEIEYLAGDMAGAEREARRVLDTADAPPATRLKARNLLGKILLARSAWQEADAHFAEDAWLAAAASLPTEELRARLNRGIALLSKGQIEEARAAFEVVLAEGERTGDSRASAFALDNLSVVATLRHDYAEALALAERTLKLRRRIGDRVATARVLGNLAELRRRLGLLEHAEHAVAFGRRSLGPGMPPARSCLFSLNAARNALSRGSAVEAQREAMRALTESEAAGVKSYAADALAVLSRVALDDGDLVRAADLIERASSTASTESIRAEIAILRARHARALGEPGDALASEALVAARASGEEDLIIEAHCLLAEIHRASDRADTARGHVDHAAALRDQVASTLPPEVRSAFLARADLVALARLQASLSAGQAEDGALSLALRSGSRAQMPPREIVGEHPSVRALLTAIRKVARASGTVLVRGESGTGKELVAEAIHRASDRASGPLVTVSCAALVETLLLSELFGHEKGAFTGAVARRRGRFELAEGGTLFLDEIGDVSARTQVALLRVLEERTYERVGGTSPIRADVRVVCATHRDLKAMVENGEFREDLYYRLCGITLEVPPLRARLTDVGLIGEHILARIASERREEPKTLSADAVELLSRHRWSGNVRELENALRAASLFVDGRTITAATLSENVDDLRAISARARAAGAPASLVSSDDGPAEDGGEIDSPLPDDEAGATSVAYAQVRAGGTSLPHIKRQIERDCIARALAETRGNITRAAALLGMKRPRLSQLVKQYGLASATGEVPE
jgi:DNA-binding NtrC family response regulator/tetratricopeptide (TPR) repeat protein